MRVSKTLVLSAALAPVLAPAIGSSALAVTLMVPGEFASVQAAIDASASGDRIEVAAGLHVGDIDFRGKGVAVVGEGPETVLQGTGTSSVVRFATGEGRGSVLDSVLVRGGVANVGGGILVSNGASPTIVRSVVIDNRAIANGSGIAIDGADSAPLVYNNLFAYNASAGGDPHTIDVSNGARPVIVNNMIVRGDSNGIITRGPSAPRIMNNIIAFNGSLAAGARRGRGICDFALNGASEITFNDFRRNRVAALLRGGQDWGRVARFQASHPGEANIHDNNDGRPGFPRRPARSVANAPLDDFRLVRDYRRTAAIDAGNPDPACNDLDGTRNDIGYTGGPFAAGASYPADGDCGTGQSLFSAPGK
jgi:hypothetical protein